jgi:hypothetical protein
MNRQFVSSSNIRSVGYNLLMTLLEIEFHGGRVYQYYGVPESHYTELMAAPSKGTYFAQFIKNNFSTTRIA